MKEIEGRGRKNEIGVVERGFNAGGDRGTKETVVRRRWENVEAAKAERSQKKIESTVGTLDSSSIRITENGEMVESTVATPETGIQIMENGKGVDGAVNTPKRRIVLLKVL